jgi:putative transposase
VRQRAARSRELVAAGYKPAVVARVARISRQALYRRPRPAAAMQPRPRPPASVDAVERAILATCRQDAHQTDGYRMISAVVSRQLGRAVNRKRVRRIMREHGLSQQRRPLERRRRPGFFVVERPDQLWHMDATSIWVAHNGWCPLLAIIDCCTREIVGWQLDLRGRAQEAISLIEQASTARAIQPGTLTLGTDNGSAFTARSTLETLRRLGITHRRGGYRDPESQAFIESWFGKLKQREVWRNQYETLDDAMTGVRGYIDRYHQRPHSLLGYRTPLEVAATWRHAPGPHTTPA